MQEVVSSSPHVTKSVWPTPKYLDGSRMFPDEFVGFYKMGENSKLIPGGSDASEEDGFPETV